METETRFRFYSRKLNDAMETETRFCFHFKELWKRKRVSVSISTTDGNGNEFPFPTNESSNHGLHINPNSYHWYTKNTGEESSIEPPWYDHEIWKSSANNHILPGT